LVKLDNRISVIECVPKLVENLKSTLSKTEQSTIVEVLAKMDKIQNQIQNMFLSRKATIVDEIRKFYRSNQEFVFVFIYLFIRALSLL
jgi:archaellum biogenesis ATPase FlaH